MALDVAIANNEAPYTNALTTTARRYNSAYVAAQHDYFWQVESGANVVHVQEKKRGQALKRVKSLRARRSRGDVRGKESAATSEAALRSKQALRTTKWVRAR